MVVICLLILGWRNVASVDLPHRCSVSAEWERICAH